VTEAFPAALQDALGERYELRHLLGRGGMASVYLAYDRKHQREVAIKVLLPDLAASIGSVAAASGSSSVPSWPRTSRFWCRS
jgi:serine/threonine protein kinase